MTTKRVVLSPTAKAKLEALLTYLKTEWSEKTMRDFLEKLDRKMILVSKLP